MIIFGPIILLGMLAFVGACTLVLARWMLTPLSDAAAFHSDRKIQFFISDIYVLILQLALTGLITSQLSRRESHGMPTAFIIWSVLILFWFIGIRTLSRAGVTKSWPRAVMLCVAVPVAYLGSFLLSGLALFCFLGNPVVLPFIAISIILLYGICSQISEWAAESRV